MGGGGTGVGTGGARSTLHVFRHVVGLGHGGAKSVGAFPSPYPFTLTPLPLPLSPKPDCDGGLSGHQVSALAEATHNARHG